MIKVIKIIIHSHAQALRQTHTQANTHKHKYPSAHKNTTKNMIKHSQVFRGEPLRQRYRKEHVRVTTDVGNHKSEPIKERTKCWEFDLSLSKGQTVFQIVIVTTAEFKMRNFVRNSQ